MEHVPISEAADFRRLVKNMGPGEVHYIYDGKEYTIFPNTEVTLPPGCSLYMKEKIQARIGWLEEQ